MNYKEHYCTDPVKGIKLYLDPKSKASKLRAIYRLLGEKLDFVQYISH